jgi:hypothetical protein
MPASNKLEAHSRSASILNAIIRILLFGSIWGFFESIVAGALFLRAGTFLRAHDICICPITGAIIGILIMALALAIYRKPAMLMGIGVVAASFKLLDIPILHGSALPAPMILRFTVNPVIFIIVTSLLFSLTGALMLKRLERRWPIRVGVGALIGFVGVVGFAYIAFYATRTDPLIANTPLELIATHGPAVVALSAVSLPLGYLASTKIRQMVVSLLARKPAFSYAVSAGVVACCWGFSASALAAFL